MQLSRPGLAIFVICAMISVTALGGCLEGNNPVVNKPPVARITSPTSGSVFDTGVMIYFDGNASYDPEKKPVSFNWSFGDNTTGTGNATTHHYSVPGKYSVGLQVSDGKKIGTDRIDVNVRQANRAPVVRFNASNLTASNEETVEFNATATTDADNDTLSFVWDFGDHNSAQGPVVSHRYTIVGNYNVTLNVTDGKTSSVGALVETVYQANRPPVPVLSATPLVAFIGDDIQFNASASTDPENDMLTAVWDFGDGSNGTGLVKKHAYSGIGNHTASATVSDGKLSRTANVIVSVIPRASIFLDWNETDYGYVVRLDADGGLANLTASVSNSLGEIDSTPDITAQSKRDFRIKTTIIPAKGLVLEVKARYWGNVMGSRTLTIYENTAMPAANSTFTMDASLSQHSFSNASDEWLNLTGSVDVVVRGWIADFVMNITSGNADSRSRSDKNETTVAKSIIEGGKSNQTFDHGAVTNTTMDLNTVGNMSTVNATGVETQKLQVRQHMEKADHNLTTISVLMNGTQYGASIVYTQTTQGVEDHANHDAKIFSCLKVHINYTADAYEMDFPNPPRHKMQFGDETQWIVRDDDHYLNTTIYHEYVTNVYWVNDTSGLWTLNLTSAAQEFLDSNGDGKFNPDPKPLSQDEAFEFHGPMPRELVVGDRIAVTNIHGVKMAAQVTEDGVRTVDGVEYAIVHVEGTYSSQSGNATGNADNWIVSEGNMTGLPIDSTESKTWKANGGKTTVTTSSFKVVTVRED